MRVKQLLDKYTDKQILQRMFEKYPDQKKSKKGYVEALKELREVKPIENNWKLQCYKYGACALPETDGEFNRGIGSSDWGFVIGCIPLRGSLDSLCNIIWEITYHGFSQKKNNIFWEDMFKHVNKVNKELKIKSGNETN